MRKWWLWVVLGLLFGGIAALAWQLMRRLQQDYDTAATSRMPAMRDDEFVPRDDPGIYFPDPATTIPLTPAAPSLDATLVSAPEAEPEPEDVNNDATTPEPPPNLSADDAQPLAVETSSPARSAENQEPENQEPRTDESTTENQSLGKEQTSDDEHDEHEEEHEGELDGITGYCVRCRTKREIQEPHVEITESGRRAARGTCPVCGTTIFRFLKDVPAE